MIKYQHKIRKGNRLGFLDVYLPIFPIFYEYSILASVSVLLLIGIISSFTKKSLVLGKDYLRFVFILFIFQIIVALKGGDLISNHFLIQYRNIIMFSIIILTLSNVLNIEKFIKVYRAIAYISIAILAFQFFEIYFLNQTVNPIRFFNLDFESQAYLNSSRPMAFFTEPQKAGTYLIPIAIFEIFNKKFKNALLITFGILLTTSSQAILVIGFIWSYAIFKMRISSVRRISMVFLSIIFTLLFVNLSIFSNSLEKILNIGSGYSDFLRLFKALITYIELPTFEKIFGVGLNNITNYILNTGINFSWMSEISNITRYQYMSTGFGIFVETGFIVSVLYYVFIIKLFEKREFLLNSLLIAMLLQMFSQTFIFNYAFVFYLLIILNYRYSAKCNKGMPSTRLIGDKVI